jgi:hypothetical protein
MSFRAMLLMTSRQSGVGAIALQKELGYGIDQTAEGVWTCCCIPLPRLHRSG